MRDCPPPQLVALLEHLGLATAAQFQRIGGRARRLARGLPPFEMVWVDALAQARILTPFQASEINAGRGRDLRIGPYVLCDRTHFCYYAPGYRARRLDTQETVQLTVLERRHRRGEDCPDFRGNDNGTARLVAGPNRLADEILSRLEALARSAPKLAREYLAPITEVGRDGDRVWAASRWVHGRRAAEWISYNGRFPPEVVLQIARAMLAGLVALEKARLVHGDISATNLVLGDDGQVVMQQPGLRAIVRPEEGYAHADLLPEAYDYLAPERVVAGTPPDAANDVYACGCLWWHLLCGRPPLAGGDSLSKLRAAQTAVVPDVRQLAPETPAILATVISACLAREPADRPESMARLAARLGAATREGRSALARCLAWQQPTLAALAWGRSSSRRPQAVWLWPATAAVSLLLVGLAVWPMFHRNDSNCPPPQSHVELGLCEPHAVDPASGAAVPGLAAANRAFSTPAPSRGLEQRLDAAGPRGGDQGSQGSPEVPRSASKADDPHAILPARYQQDTDAGKATESIPTRAQDASPSPPNLVLPAGKPIRAQSLVLRPGLHVCSAPGKRASLVVPPQGLAVDVSDVRFENIDFIHTAPVSPAASPSQQPAIICLRAGKAEFRGCLFRALPGTSVVPVAVLWIHPAESSGADLALPSGRLQFKDCVFDRVAAGIDCRTLGARSLQLAGVLHLDAGPLVRLDHCPKQEEPLSITATQVTMRSSGPLLECRYVGIADPPAEVSIQATRCAFAPARGSALLFLAGGQPPNRLLTSIQWTGEGSLVTPEAAIAAWRKPNGEQRVLDDAALSIAGLVRSEIVFGGQTDSRVVRWQAPLASADPPGADPSSLPPTTD